MCHDAVFYSNHLKKTVIRSNAFSEQNDIFSSNWPGHAAACPTPPLPVAGTPTRWTARRATVQLARRHVPSPGYAAAPLRRQLANRCPLPTGRTPAWLAVPPPHRPAIQPLHLLRPRHHQLNGDRLDSAHGLVTVPTATTISGFKFKVEIFKLVIASSLNL